MFIDSILHNLVHSPFFRRFILGNITSDAVGPGIKDMFSDILFGGFEIRRYRDFVGSQAYGRIADKLKEWSLTVDKVNSFDSFDFTDILHWPFRNGFPIDVNELSSEYILSQISQLSKPRPRTLMSIGAAILCMAAMGITYWWWTRRRGDGQA
jgi:hypothetical protein